MGTRQTPFTASTFVAIGDGLAAGAGDFGLSEITQAHSFPNLVARQLGADFSQPLIEAPGIGPVIGTQDLPTRVPVSMQTTVLVEFPPSGPFSNISIPGITLAESLTRRPVSPLLHRSDTLQTAVNLILGMPGLLMPGSQPLPTQAEYAAYRQPTFALVALGLTEVFTAAFRADASWIPDEVSFRLQYGSLLSNFGRTPSTVMVATLPDPSDTAALTRVADAEPVLKAEPALVQAMFGLAADDCLTPEGLMHAGTRLITNEAGPLPAGSVVPAAVAARLTSRVAGLNAQLRALAAERGAIVFELGRLLADVRRDGVRVGDRTLTGRYLGGFYGLNGVFPGAVGHGVIANGVITALNTTVDTAFPLVDLEALAANDPVAAQELGNGPSRTVASQASVPTRGPVAVVREGRPAPQPVGPPRERITLPESLEVVLPLNTESSYFGDALRACHATIERDVPYGSSPNLLFGGLCLTQSHLSGSVRVRFSPPEGDIARFEMSLGAGLTGTDGTLVAPQFFQLPSIGNVVTDIEGLTSTGELNLATGEVSNLKAFVGFTNTALVALVSVNPKIPPTPIEYSNEERTDASSPHYGSVFAKFEQRQDGTLDFLFSGVTFLPLGPGFGGDTLRFPLPFAGPSMHFASIPAVGTALHPHLMLNTRPPEPALDGAAIAALPTNTVREYTVYTHGAAFGDKFSLNVPDMEGGATGRSHLMGRLIVQFGTPTANSLPFTFASVLPGGMFAKPPDSPVAKAFPGRLSVGLIAHDETLRFQKISYHMTGVAWVDDPFEASIGSIDLRTGRVLGNLIYRGFIVQDVLLTLLQLEPRVQKSSWHMRGPAAFQQNGDGQTVFTFSGGASVPYPEGFGFPKPDLKSLYSVGPNSALDPYIYLTAADGVAPPPAGLAGEASGIVASNGQRFSYKYSLPGFAAGKPALFEYTNEAKKATFKMGNLLWVSYTNRNRPAKPGDCDCVTFTGVGLWSADMTGPHMCTVQISTDAEHPYVSIQLDGGMLSNVNTKPTRPLLPFPEYERC